MVDSSEVLVSKVRHPDEPGMAREVERSLLFEPHLSFPPCILFAEDDPALRSALASALRNQGYEVVECRNGWDLLDHLDCIDHPYAADDFDLIISDIRMPGANGLEILGTLRLCQDNPPMLLITAFGDEATHEEAQRSGAVGVLNKPFEVDDLLARVAEVI